MIGGKKIAKIENKNFIVPNSNQTQSARLYWNYIQTIPVIKNLNMKNLENITDASIKNTYSYIYSIQPIHKTANQVLKSGFLLVKIKN